MCRTMCSAQVLNNNMSNLTKNTSVNPNPATEALKRATKRRRVEDSPSLECTKVSKKFDLDDMFAQLPTNDEAFPSISWDFDDAFGSDDSLLASLRTQMRDAAPQSSSMKRSRTEEGCNPSSSSGLVRSKSVRKLHSMMEFSSAPLSFDLQSEVRLARELGEAVLSRTKFTQHHVVSNNTHTKTTSCRQEEQCKSSLLVGFFHDSRA